MVDEIVAARPVKKQLTETKKAFALGMLQSGMSQGLVANKMNVSRKTINRLAVKSKALGPLKVPKRKEGSGPVKTLSLLEMLRLKKIVKRSPKMSARMIRQLHPFLQKISIRVLQRILKNDLNLPCRRPAKKPLLTDAMREKRLKFARDHLNWTVEDWAKVMFTDESTFRTIRSSGSTMVSFFINFFLVQILKVFFSGEERAWV